MGPHQTDQASSINQDQEKEQTDQDLHHLPF